MALRLFLFLSCLFLLTTSREQPWADAHVVYDTTQALVNHGRLDVTLDGPPWFFSYNQGKKYGAFPLGNVLAMVPSYVSFQLLLRTRLFAPHPLFCFTSHLSPALLMAGAGVLLYRLARRRGASERMAALLAVAMSVATICFCYARSSYGEALQTFLLLWFVERTLRAGERYSIPVAATLGLAAGCLFNSKLVYALVLPLAPLFIAWRFHETRERPASERPAPTVQALILRGLVSLAAALPLFGLALVHNYIKTGSPWRTGYQIQSGVFSGDLLPALYGYVFSTGKSVFLYSPPLVLGLLGVGTALRRHRAETLFVLAVIAVVMAFNAKFRAWHGDYCWGPRYLVPLTPLGLFLALPWLPEALARGNRLLRRTALAAVLASGLFVQVLGAAFYWDHYIRILIEMKDQTGAPGWFQEQLGHGHYMPQFSPLRGHLWLLGHYLRKDADLDKDAPWKLLVPQRVDLRARFAVLRLDFWAADFVGSGPGPRQPFQLPLLLGVLLLGAGLGGAGVLRRLREPCASD